LTQLDLKTLLLSLETAGLATILVAFVATPLAWAMARHRFRGQFVVDGLFLTPLILPPTVTGFVLLQLLGVHGPLGSLWMKIFGESFIFTKKAAVIAAAVVAFPLMYRTARSAFEQIEPSSLDAAVTLGAKPWYLFRTIGWSESLPGLIGALTLAFGRALGEFGATLIVAGNIEGKTQTIPTAIYTAIESGNSAQAGMWSCVLGALAITIAVAGQYTTQRRY
jgi:molybdate transport system permease protein